MTQVTTRGVLFGPADRQMFGVRHGAGPGVLMIHGAGSSHQAWSEVQQHLSEFETLAVDLPGHGSSPRWDTPPNYDVIAQTLAEIVAGLGWQNFDIVGHSAGGAVALEMARNQPTTRVVCVNPALASFSGPAKFAFPAAARMLDAFSPARGLVQTWLARPSALDRLLGETGSTRTPQIDAHYTTLAAQETHLAGTIRMMASWDLTQLQDQLPQITSQVSMLVGANDRVVSPAVAQKAATRLPNATVQVFANRGHLLHEEAPVEFATQIRALLT